MLAGGRCTRLQLRHGISYCRNRATAALVQRRLLNHFITEPSHDADVIEGAFPSKIRGGTISSPEPPAEETKPIEPFRLAVKDNIVTHSDLPTTCASNILGHFVSPFEATIVKQLRARGAQIVGKTNMDEFGMGSHSTNSAWKPVVNPISPPGTELSAGGSSGGSAAAVKAGEADIALGTDTGGSVRLPAAYTGVVGYKPSYGMLSRFGVVPYANSLDTVGLLANSVAKIKNLIVEGNLYSEHDPQDPTSLPPTSRGKCLAARKEYTYGRRPAGREQMDMAESGKTQSLNWRTNPEVTLRGTRFGIPLEYNIDELDPCIREAWVEVAERLLERGAEILPVSLPNTRHALSAYYVIAPAEASSNLAKYDGIRYGTRDLSRSDRVDDILYSKTRDEGFGEEVKRRILLGSYTLSSEAMDNYFIKAQKVRRLVRRDFNRVFRLENPLQEPDTFDLSEIDESVPLKNKLGPAQVDFLLCPTAPTLPPTLDEVMKQTPVDSYMNDVFTVPASLAGLPAISLPVKVRSDGPVDFAGLQLIGQYWDDARMLTIAEFMTATLDGIPGMNGFQPTSDVKRPEDGPPILERG